MYGSYVLPVMGGMLGHQAILDYLVESTKEFPDKVNTLNKRQINL
jgi:hypothetical protein